MATQADVDALTTALDQVATDLAASQATLQVEIDKLAGPNPGLNFDGLRAEVAKLDPMAQAIGALKPTPPVVGATAPVVGATQPVVGATDMPVVGASPPVVGATDTPPPPAVPDAPLPPVVGTTGP